MGNPLPTLYVEGPEDRTVIGALLSRNGCETEQGKRHLYINRLAALRRC